MNSDAGLFATVNPLARQMANFIRMPSRSNIAAHAAGQDESLVIAVDVHLISSEKNPCRSD
ncbi:hypothetical protein E2562_008144 [Oryza meyeriana var. granulata]|uniref:Uncharacterized protein n=1 Tax=Oryza meyeriana var. granulata TaxID=110450 RepID=A0A6G1CEU6_9ORYZ|nr:hypothetical protein E2562_008144 [Oryza meyeriana var. granulata]